VDAIRIARDLWIMRYDQKRHATLLTKTPKQFEHTSGVLAIKTPCGLVGEH